MQTGRILEDTIVGNYRMVFLKVTQQSSFMHYHYRLIAFPKGEGEPVLSLNLESNPSAGTCCLGAHLPEGHDNLGFADENMQQSEFRAWAYEISKRYLGLAQSLPPIPEAELRVSGDDEKTAENLPTHTDDLFRDLGNRLLAPPLRGAVTDYEHAQILRATMPNTLNAWTHAVPALEKYARSEGKVSFWGQDKGKIAYDKLWEKLVLVILGLYGDGLLLIGASTEDCLAALVRSLLAFKETYPNWTDAYTAASRLFVVERSKTNLILALYQHAIEAKLC